MGIYERVNLANMEVELPKSFSSSIGFIAFSAKNLLLMLGLIALIYVRMSTSEINPETLKYGSIIFFLLLIGGFYYRYSKYVKISTYTFYEDKILWNKNGFETELFLKDIIYVKSADEKTKKSVGQDFITIKFSDGQKLSFTSGEPNFNEIKQLLIYIFTKKNLSYLKNVT
jgi:hypothetical protein